MKSVVNNIWPLDWHFDKYVTFICKLHADFNSKHMLTCQVVELNSRLDPLLVDGLASISDLTSSVRN